MKRYLLGGLAAAGLLLGGLTVSGGSASADQVDDKDVGDEYECPAGSTSDYKVDNLNSETYTVPSPSSPDLVIVAVVVKASTQHRTYSPVTPGQVLNVKVDMGHNISHAHICEGPKPPPPPSSTEAPPSSTEAPPSSTEAPPSSTEAPPSSTEAPPSSEATTEVAAQGPVPPPAAPPAPASATASAVPTQLPSTGSSSWGLALTALASLLGGLGLVKLSRRTS